MDYRDIAAFIIDNVGGWDNVQALTHCMTRLRFDLKDDSKANEEALRDNENIVGVVKSAGQFQVVLGQHVSKVYEQIIAIKDNQIIEVVDTTEKRSSNLSSGVPSGEANDKKVGIFSKLISTIVGIVGPLLPILIGAGLGRAILALIVQFGWVNTEVSLTYKLFNMVFDAGFTYLPIFVAISAAKHFKTNVYLAALLGMALVHPTWSASVDVLNPQFIGKIFSFVPVYGMSYTSSIIPSILVVWVMSKVDHFLNKKLPDLIKPTFGPLLLLAIMIPATFVVLAPVMGVVSNLLGNAMLWFFNTFGGIGLGILGLIYPWMVATGTHSTLAVGGLQILGQNGFDPISRTLTMGANMAQAGATFAASIKTKDVKLKSMSLSAGVTALVAGITEPALYTVSLQYRKIMYAVMAGSAAGSLFGGLMGLKAFAFMSPSVINIPMWIGEGAPNNVIIAIISMLIAFLTTFVITLFMKVEGLEEGASVNKK